MKTILPLLVVSLFQFACSTELCAQTAASAADAKEQFRKTLVAHTWSWVAKPGDKGVTMTFKGDPDRLDGDLDQGGTPGTWKITGPREVTIFTAGSKHALYFDDKMESYVVFSRAIKGRRLK